MTIRDDITIDWEVIPRVITVASPSDEITIQDLVDTCRFYEQQLVNMDDPHLINAAGKEFLGGTTYVGITATLQNAVLSFEARGGPSWVLCTISGGNLVALDSNGNIVDPRLPTAYVSCDRTASASATLQEQAALQYASYNGGVAVDILSSHSGTEYPIGTEQAPVNNITDALVIAADRGFTTFYISGDITLDSGTDFDEAVFVGESKTKSIITIDADADVTNCEFYDAQITGVLDGGNVLKNCLIGNINYVNGFIEQCVLEAGTIILGGNEEAHFLDCWSGVVGAATPIIDMGGSGQGLGMRNYNGGIELKNKSGSEKINIDLNSGHVVLDSTITNGEVVIRGIGKVTDNSVGATVNIDDLVSPSTVANAVWEEPQADHLSAGTTGEILNRILASTEIRQAAVDDISASATKFETNLSETTNGFWARGAILFTGGNNNGLIRAIKSYNGTNKEIQLQTPLSFTPEDADTFIITTARKFLTPDIVEIAAEVWAYADAQFLLKIIKNKKILKKTAGVWELIIYDNDNITPVLQKDLKDSTGADISDLEAGTLAMELKSSI